MAIRNGRPVVLVAFGLQAEAVLFEWYRKTFGLTRGLLESQRAIILSPGQGHSADYSGQSAGFADWIEVVPIADQGAIDKAVASAFSQVCSRKAQDSSREAGWRMDIEQDPPVVYFLVDGSDYKGESFDAVFASVQREFSTGARQAGASYSHTFLLSPRLTEGQENDTASSPAFVNSAKLLLEIAQDSESQDNLGDGRLGVFPIDTHTMGGTVEVPGKALQRNVVDLMGALMEYSVVGGARSYPGKGCQIVSSLRCGLPVEEIVLRGKVEFINDYFFDLHGSEEKENIEQISMRAREWLRSSGLFSLFEDLPCDENGRAWEPRRTGEIDSTGSLVGAKSWLSKYWARLDSYSSFLAARTEGCADGLKSGLRSQIEEWLESDSVNRQSILSTIEVMRGVGGQSRSIASTSNDNIEDLDYGAVLSIQGNFSKMPKVPQLISSGAKGIQERLKKLIAEDSEKAEDLMDSIIDDDGDSINTRRLAKNHSYSEAAEDLRANSDDLGAELAKLESLSSAGTERYCTPAEAEDQSIGGWSGNCEQVMLPSGRKCLIPNIAELQRKEDDRRSILSDIELLKDQLSQMPEHLLTRGDTDQSESLTAQIVEKAQELDDVEKQINKGQSCYLEYRASLRDTRESEKAIENAKDRLLAEFHCAESVSFQYDANIIRKEQQYKEYIGEAKKGTLKKYIFATLILVIAPAVVGWGLFQLSPGTNPVILGDLFSDARIIEGKNDQVSFSVDTATIEYRLPAGLWNAVDIVRLLNGNKVSSDEEAKILSTSVGFDQTKLRFSEFEGAIVLSDSIAGSESTVSVAAPSSNSAYSLIGLAVKSRTGVNPEILGNPFGIATIVENKNDLVSFTVDRMKVEYQLPAGSWTTDEIVRFLNGKKVPTDKEVEIVSKSSGFNRAKLSVAELEGAIVLSNPIIGPESTVSVTAPSQHSACSAIGLEEKTVAGGGIWSTKAWQVALWAFAACAIWQALACFIYLYKRDRKAGLLLQKVEEEQEDQKRMFKLMRGRPSKYADFVMGVLTAKSVFNILERTSKLFELNQKRVEAYFQATDEIKESFAIWSEENGDDLPRSLEFFSFLTWEQVDSDILGGEQHRNIFRDAFISFKKSWPAKELWRKMELEDSGKVAFPVEWRHQFESTINQAFSAINNYQIDSWLDQDGNCRLFDSGSLLNDQMKQLVRPLAEIDPDETIDFNAVAQVPDASNPGGCKRIFEGLLSSLTIDPPEISSWDRKSEVNCLLISQGVKFSDVVFIHDSTLCLVQGFISEGDIDSLLSLNSRKLTSCCDVYRAISRNSDFDLVLGTFVRLATEQHITIDDGVLSLHVGKVKQRLGRGIVDSLLWMSSLIEKHPFLSVSTPSIHGRPEDASAAWDSFCGDWTHSKDLLKLRTATRVLQNVKDSWRL